MNDIVTRLRNWRDVHLARLHLLMDEAADEMERLRADWPEQLDAAHSEIERLRLTDVERSAVERAVKDESEHGLVYTADRLQSMLDRLSGSGDCPASDNAANEDNLLAEVRRLRAAIAALADQDATLSVCNGNVTVTMDATLTEAERAAIEWSINDQIAGGHQDHPTVKAVIATLRGLLGRLGGGR